MGASDPTPAEVRPAEAKPAEVLPIPVASEKKGFMPTALTEWIDILAKIGAVFVVAFGIYQYLDSKTGVRITRTQDFMKEYSSGSVAEARHTVSQTLRSNLPVIEKLRALSMKPEAATDAHADIVRFFVWDSRDSKGLADELDTVIDFYERLVICVENSLCDRSIARAYFQADALWLFRNFRPYILDRRANSPNFAVVAERLTSL